MPGMRIDVAPKELKAFVKGVVDDMESHVGDRLVAVLLHGSLAIGSFYPPKSDVDLIVIVSGLADQQASRVYDLFEDHHARRPYAGGLEVSVIRSRDAKFPKHPLPYLVHFSETTAGFQAYRDGYPPTDQDLIAHLTVAKHRGISLFGPQPACLIGELSWTDYLSSVSADIEWILEDQNILRSPYYGVLNLCRWAMMRETQERIVRSKEEAGVWGLSHLPTFTEEVVGQALTTYRSSEWPCSREERQTAGGPWDRQNLIRFRDYMRSRHEGAVTR
jgi:hypothetical protein